MTPKQHYKKVMSRGKMAPIDMDRYPKRRGLEGPFRFRNGRIVYYDPKEGKYYDSGTDMYLSDKETMKLHESGDMGGLIERPESLVEASDAARDDEFSRTFFQYGGDEWKKLGGASFKDSENSPVEVVRYEVVSRGGKKRETFDSLKELVSKYAKGRKVKRLKRSGARRELKGQPELEGLMGPFYNGMKKKNVRGLRVIFHTIRYEDPGTFKSYSESREDALEGFVRYMEEGSLDAYMQSRDDAQTKRRLERWMKDPRSSKADPEALRYLAKAAGDRGLMSADDPNPEAALEELSHLLGFESASRGGKGQPLKPKYMKMLVGLGRVYNMNVKREIEAGRKDAMNESEEDIFTVLGPGTPVGESNSGRGFHWKAVNRAIDRLGDQMMAELGDAFEELDLHQNTDHMEAAEKMKEYLEATFNEVRDRVEMYETNAITRSKKAARRRR